MDSQTLPLDTSDSFQIIPSKNYEFKDASPFYYLPQVRNILLNNYE